MSCKCLACGHHTSAVLPDFLTAYNVYILLILLFFSKAGWAILWMLDPPSRERDLQERVKAATQEALLSQIQKTVEQVDITQAVDNADSEVAVR